MKKIALVIALSSAGGLAYAGTMGPVAQPNYWNGFYIGANAGYWWSQNNSVNTVGDVTFINPVFPLGAGNIADALATIGTNNLNANGDGFIGGGQVGYNYQFSNQVLIGLDIDIDGLTNSNNSKTVNEVVVLDDFDEFYDASININKKIDYLGTVRGRLGFLCSPTFLLYGQGGFAYGGVSLRQSYLAAESLGVGQYPVVAAQSTTSKTATGWTAGVGGEWMFRPQWSAKLEYNYYDLGNVHNNNLELSQINNLAIPPAVWGTALVSASSRFAANTVRVGLNYHFA